MKIIPVKVLALHKKAHREANKLKGDRNMDLKPTRANVIVRRDEVVRYSKGGIALPDAATDKPRQGIVLAVGPGVHEYGVFVKPAIKKGDRVLFGAYAGNEVDTGAEKLIVLQESEVMAVVGK